MTVERSVQVILLLNLFENRPLTSRMAERHSVKCTSRFRQAELVELTRAFRPHPFPNFACVKNSEFGPRFSIAIVFDTLNTVQTGAHSVDGSTDMHCYDHGERTLHY